MTTNVISDMDDADDMPESPTLRGLLVFCQERILPAFRKADANAVRFQENHRRLAQSVSWLGAAATILATFQLFVGAVLDRAGPAKPEWPRWVAGVWDLLAAHVSGIEVSLGVIELTVVLIMFSLIIHGLRRASQQRHLLERFKAERLRLLKFGYLLNPDVWSGDDALVQRAKEELPRRVDEIVSAMRPSLDRWVSEGAVPRVWPGPKNELSGPDLVSLVGYYRRKRLEYQMKYLAWATKRSRERDEETRVPVAVLFFGSVVFVLIHVIVEGLDAKILSQFFVLLAAALPALVTPMRLVRSAYESARNASRFEASYNTLEGLADRLSKAENSSAVFRELGFCEQVLEADHREWMRLMAEAEWFG